VPEVGLEDHQVPELREVMPEQPLLALAVVARRPRALERREVGADVVPERLRGRLGGWHDDHHATTGGRQTIPAPRARAGASPRCAAARRSPAPGPTRPRTAAGAAPRDRRPLF